MRTKTERAGLVLSVGRISRRLNIDDDGAVFLSSVIENTVDELLKLAGNAARFNYKKVIRPRNILTAVKIDGAYGKLLRKTWISGAGVLPYAKAVAELTQAKEKFHSAEARKGKNKRRREGEDDDEEETTVRKKARARSEKKKAGQDEEDDPQPKKKTRNAAPATVSSTTKTKRPTKITKAQLRVQEKRERDEAYQKMVQDTHERTTRQMAEHQASLEQQDENAIDGVGVKQAAKKADTVEARKKAEAEAKAKARIVGLFHKAKKNAAAELERKAEEERKAAALAEEQRKATVKQARQASALDIQVKNVGEKGPNSNAEQARSQVVGQDGNEEDEPTFSSSEESYGIGLSKEEIESRIDIISDQVFEERQRSQERGSAKAEEDDDDEDGNEEDEPTFSSSEESYGIGLSKKEIENRIDIISDQVFEERQRSQERGPAKAEEDDDEEDEEGDDDETDEEGDNGDEEASSSGEE